MVYFRYRVKDGRLPRLNMVAVALALCLGLGALAQAGEDQWTMTAVDGVAMVTGQGNEAHAARQGHAVAAGATLVTGDDGTVTLERRGDSITVFPNSEMTIPDLSDSGRLGVFQRLGKLLFRMETRELRNFEVRTPFLAATVKGTVFTVEVAADNATVTVTEGSVLVAPARGGRSQLVNAGSRASVNTSNANQVTVEVVAGGQPSGGKKGRGRGKSAGVGPSDKGGPPDDGAQGGGSQGGGSQGGGSQGGGSRGGGSQDGGSQDGDSQGDQQ